MIYGLRWAIHRVMTVSFHKFGEYFPGTGDVKDKVSDVISAHCDAGGVGGGGLHAGDLLWCI